jgi:methylated-DNA-[protein]-cysteine S-methyltransferase
MELRLRDGRLTGLRLCRDGRARGSVEVPGLFRKALEDYLAGRELRLPSDALDLGGATAFQRHVYDELRRVPFGRVVTYGELGARVGRPRGARAVGQAVGRNPLPLVIPCHRVVAAGGRLGGFGAGLAWKRALLSHEGWTVQNGRITR